MLVTDSTKIWRKFRGAGHADNLFARETIALRSSGPLNGPELTSKWIISTGQSQSKVKSVEHHSLSFIAAMANDMIDQVIKQAKKTRAIFINGCG